MSTESEATPAETFAGLTIADCRELIRLQEASIQRGRERVALIRRNIVNLIKSGISSDDPVADLVFLLGGHPSDQTALYENLQLFSDALLARRGQCIVFEHIRRTDAIHTTFSDPDLVRIPHIDHPTFMAGILKSDDVYPLVYQEQGKDGPLSDVRIRVLCSCFEETEPLYLSMPVLAFGFLKSTHTQPCFGTLDDEPAEFSCGGNDGWRYYIGNDAVSALLFRMKFFKKERHTLSRKIWRLLEREQIVLAPDDPLAEELEPEATPIEHAAT